MFDYSNYSCENQMSFDECLKEIEKYKWETGQYMNLPETEESENGNQKNSRHIFLD